MKNFKILLSVLVASTFIFAGCDKEDDAGQNNNPGDKKYTCNSGNCSEDENGNFSSLSDCENSCGGNNTNTGTVEDIDGNVYQTVQIGDQVWMAENLRTSKYNNGDTIPELDEDIQQGTQHSMPIGFWVNYDFNGQYDEQYGKLYSSSSYILDNICPTGWHLPTDDDWKTLEIHLEMLPSDAASTGWRGEEANVGGKLKSTEKWDSPNAGADNETGFSAMPGGRVVLSEQPGPNEDIIISVSFSKMGTSGYWWNKPISSSNHRELQNARSDIKRDLKYYQSYAYSVRCIKD